MSSLTRCIILVVLLLCSAFFSMTESAFSYCNQIKLKVAADDGSKSAKLALNCLKKFDKYLKYGGMPMLINMRDNENLMINYLNDIKEVVLKKDVINRNNIKDVVFLDNLIKYMASCIGNL